MTPQERELIQGLFDRVAAASGPRDPQAERLIADELAANRDAAYYLVQAVLVQEEALKAADARIRELEASKAEAARPATSFLGGAGPWGSRPGPARDEARGVDAPRPGFGPRGSAMPPPLPPGYGQQGGQPGPAQASAPQAAAGDGRPSFLSGALQTAAGVAGGALLFSGISSLMGGHGFGGGGSGSQQGLGNANWSNESQGAGLHEAGGGESWRDGTDISGFGNQQGFADSSGAQDAGWETESDGGAIQDASWADDGDDDWGGDEV